MEITTEMLKEAVKKLKEAGEKRIIPVCMGRYRFEVCKENLDEFLELFKKDKNLLKKLDKYFDQQEGLTPQEKDKLEEFYGLERLKYLLE